MYMNTLHSQLINQSHNSRRCDYTSPPKLDHKTAASSDLFLATNNKAMWDMYYLTKETQSSSLDGSTSPTPSPKQ